MKAIKKEIMKAIKKETMKTMKAIMKAQMA